MNPRFNRWAAIAVVAVCLFITFFAIEAIAQVVNPSAPAPEAPDDLVSKVQIWIMAATAIAYGLLKTLETALTIIAPLTKSTADDEALAWIRGNRDRIDRGVQTVERYADPNDQLVPIAPVAAPAPDTRPETPA